MPERRLAAILAADVAGYSRLMEADEEGTHDFLKSILREEIEPRVAAHHGTLIKTTGDGALVEFGSAVDAVRCALEVQRGIALRNAARPAEKRAELRIGVNVGDVIADEGDIFGNGVNVAARLEGLAEPGGVCISGAVYDHIAGKIEAGFDDLGPQTVKNISRPVQVLRIRERRGDESATGVSAPVPGFQGRPAIAVLPFQNMSGDAEQEYLADGIVEDLLTRLAMWRAMPVIARNSTFRYRGKSVDIQQVGRDLGARYVMEGSVRKAGDRVRITAQLIDAETGHHIWAERYDRRLADMFDLQDEITEAIATALQPAMGQAERSRASLKPPASLDAWELTQRGMALFAQVTKESVEAARDAFRRAIALDPNFSLPYTGLSGIGIIEILFAWAGDPQKALADTLDAARRALEADRLDAGAHRSLCYAYVFSGQHDAAVAAGRQSVELNPSFAMGYHALGVALMCNGNNGEAIECFARAIRISPHDPWMFELLGALSCAQYLAREYERSAETARAAIRLAPQYPVGYRTLANALGQLGRLDEARDALAKLLEISPGYDEKAARRSPPLREEAHFQHWVEGLRKAGWKG